jgi:hypothetical protein
MSTIASGNTINTAFTVTGDTTGNLVFTTQAGTNTITVPNETGTLLTNKTVGTIVQVTSGTLTSPFGTSSASLVSTGLTASITPKSATNKILIQILGGLFDTGGSTAQILATVYRNATNLANTTGFIYSYGSVNGIQSSAAFGCIDSPATTSATSYTVYIASTFTAGTVTLSVPTGGRITLALTEIVA